MDTYTADTITVDLSDLSSTGQAWDPYYGAVPPVTISTDCNTGPSWTFSDLSITPLQRSKITLDGENADIEINGRSLMQILDGLEQRLGLLKCREDLEADWSELRALGDQYRAKLIEIENKNKMWNTLKS